jgi:hypothetical protein
MANILPDKTPTPPPTHYKAGIPKEINTLGDHIRTRRLELNLLQKQVVDVPVSVERVISSPFTAILMNFHSFLPCIT